MSETERSVVCKSCGAEVSPYVTECPYCGTRLRKRAPELERRDGSLEPKRSRREIRKERRREARQRRLQARSRTSYAAGTGVIPSRALLILLAVPLLALVVRVATGSTPVRFGALNVPFDQEWWRFAAAPFVYDSIGYLFVAGLALVLFTPGIERRLGTAATVILLFASGALGMLAAWGIADAFGQVTVFSGGNGIALGAIAAWYITGRQDPERADVAATAVSAAVILLLPLVVDGVSIWAGIAGGLVGLLAALVAVRAGK